MKSILLKLLGRAGDLVDVQPVIALFLGGALLAVFLAAAFHPRPEGGADAVDRPLWKLYGQLTRVLWALLLVTFLVGALSLLRVYLHQTLTGFQRSHGRVTQANYNAVQTIWGAEQSQGDLQFDLFYEEEVTERIESEDLTKPAVLRKKTVRHNIAANPFLGEHHEVSLRQNARRKGSAFYGGYETTCRFSWRLRNPADRDLKSVLKFPLPAAGAMYDDLVATLNGKDILPQMQLQDGALVLPREAKANEILDLTIAFKSRGMSVWYFQVKEPRELRDFTLTLTLPDLAQAHLNNPEGCMSPTAVRPTANKQGCVATYRLDHAISNKGMGIALPTPPQPGEITTAVLAEVERGWLLIFGTLVLGLTLAGAASAPLLSVMFAAAAACGYGLLADCSDFLFGFWGTAVLVLVPMFVLLAWLLRRVAPGCGNRLGLQLLLFGLLYPCLAGLDSDRQTLYFNLSALTFLGLAAWQLAGRFGHGAPSQRQLGVENEPATTSAPGLQQAG